MHGWLQWHIPSSHQLGMHDGLLCPSHEHVLVRGHGSNIMHACLPDASRVETWPEAQLRLMCRGYRCSGACERQLRQAAHMCLNMQQ
jgi:hypothetical protein